MDDAPFFDYDACTIDALIRALDDRLRTQAAEIKSLKEKTQYWPDNAERDAVIKYQKAEIARLLNVLADTRTENMRLRAALEPFADVIKGNWSQQPDDLPLDVGFGATDLRLKLRLGDFRTAYAALEEARA